MKRRLLFGVLVLVAATSIEVPVHWLPSAHWRRQAWEQQLAQGGPDAVQTTLALACSEPSMALRHRADQVLDLPCQEAPEAAVCAAWRRCRVRSAGRETRSDRSFTWSRLLPR